TSMPPGSIGTTGTGACTTCHAVRMWCGWGSARTRGRPCVGWTTRRRLPATTPRPGRCGRGWRGSRCPPGRLFEPFAAIAQLLFARRRWNGILGAVILTQSDSREGFVMSADTPTVNRWHDRRCARAFWSQAEVPAHQQLLADTAAWL